MSFPAFEDFAADRAVTQTVFRLYMHLQREALDHVEPRQQLIWHLSETIRMRPASVISGLNWLVDHGYLVEHGRGERGIRHFTLAWSRSSRKKAA